MTPWSSAATRHMQGTENPDLERLWHGEAWVGWVFSIYCGSGREEGGEMGSSKTRADRGRRQRSETTQKQAWGRLGAAGPAAGRDSRCFIKRGLGPWAQGRPGRTSLGQTREVPGPSVSACAPHFPLRFRPCVPSEPEARPMGMSFSSWQMVWVSASLFADKLPSKNEKKQSKTGFILFPLHSDFLACLLLPC